MRLFDKLFGWWQGIIIGSTLMVIFAFIVPGLIINIILGGFVTGLLGMRNVYGAQDVFWLGVYSGIIAAIILGIIGYTTSPLALGPILGSIFRGRIIIWLITACIVYGLIGGFCSVFGGAVEVRLLEK